MLTTDSGKPGAQAEEYRAACCMNAAGHACVTLILTSSVVLPEPEAPTSAVRMPGLKQPLTSLSSSSMGLPWTWTTWGPSWSGSVPLSCSNVH